jgi:hypothetical protein
MEAIELNNHEYEVMSALDQLVEWSRSRELPTGELIRPLQDVLKDSNLFTELVKQFPFPFGVFDRNGKLEMANDKLLEGTDFVDADIRAGRGDIYGIDSLDFRNAVKLALRGETSVVKDLESPLENIGTGYADEKSKNMSAVLFPVIEDNDTILRGAVLFLPLKL